MLKFINLGHFNKNQNYSLYKKSMEARLANVNTRLKFARDGIMPVYYMPVVGALTSLFEGAIAYNYPTPFYIGLATGNAALLTAVSTYLIKNSKEERKKVKDLKAKRDEIIELIKEEDERINQMKSLTKSRKI